MNEIGEFLGIIIIILYVLTVSKYIMRWINKKFEHQLNNNDKLLILFNKIKKIITKYHRLFGISTIIFLLIHFIIQFISTGISITGIIAALFLMFQVALGIYGVNAKHKYKHWLTIHRIISLVMLLAILIHII